MAIAKTDLYGTGNAIYSTAAQGGVYQNWAYTAPLHWNTAYTAPTPTGSALTPPTVGVSYPHTVFMGESSGYWVHKLYLDGHLVKTVTAVDQQFTMPVMFDRVESVALPFSPTEFGTGCTRADCDVPSPAGAAVLLVSAVLVRFRNRKA